VAREGRACWNTVPIRESPSLLNAAQKTPAAVTLLAAVLPTARNLTAGFASQAVLLPRGPGRPARRAPLPGQQPSRSTPGAGDAPSCGRWGSSRPGFSATKPDPVLARQRRLRKGWGLRAEERAWGGGCWKGRSQGQGRGARIAGFAGCCRELGWQSQRFLVGNGVLTPLRKSRRLYVQLIQDGEEELRESRNSWRGGRGEGRKNTFYP